MAGREQLRSALPELLKFGVIGGLGYATDVVLFVLLRDPLGPVLGKVVSLSASTAVAFVGNKYWTFRERRAGAPTGGTGRETALFLVVNLVGALVQLGCLGFSHYLLKLTSPTADLVSSSVIGMALATALRFWGTRTLVFREARA
ncbi:GtrA family protein [Kitasatospora sp. NPDC058162]|uniref:GtrA family protein n=1 Tax=Kitasatospora sp. NPDC058162 TaxID=3346362 RepID=UPI0036DAF525